MEKDTSATTECSDFVYRLNRTDFIVCSHDGNENCIRSERLFHTIHRCLTTLIHRQIGDFKAFFIPKIFTWVENCVMFDRTGDYVLSFIVKVSRHAQNCQIIALRSATCKNYLAWLALPDGSHAVPRLIEQCPCSPADMMH